MNQIERLWRYFKRKVMKNQYYDDYTKFENEIEEFLKTFSDKFQDMKTLLNFKFGIIKAS
jgi:transposase